MKWLELLNSIKIGNDIKEIVKRKNAYLESIFSSMEKNTMLSLGVKYLTEIPISLLPAPVGP